MGARGAGGGVACGYRRAAPVAAALPALLWLLAPVGGVAAEPPPADPRAEWRVGFTELRAVVPAADDGYLGGAIPRLLRERLAPIRRHWLTPEERLEHARRVLADAARAQRAQVAELQRQRDGEALAGADTAALDEQLGAAGARLEELRALAAEELEIAAHKPLVMAGTGRDDPLLPAPRFAPLRTAREADLDLLLTGALEETDGVLFLRLDAVDGHRGRVLLSYRDVVRRDAVAVTVDELERRFAPLLTGEPWGVITVEPTPAQSAVYLDGAFAGFGVTEVRYLPLGRYTVRVTAPGHQPLEQTVALAGSGWTLAPALEPLPPQPITVVSAPPGAALYLDSRYLGVTPLTVPVTERPARLLLRLDGYRDASVVLRPGAGSPLRVELAPDSYDRAQRQLEQRNRFYDRLGEVVLSLAGPLLLFTAAGEAEQAGAAGPDHGLLLGGGIASLTVSGALLVRAGVALGDYLEAANAGAR